MPDSCQILIRELSEFIVTIAWIYLRSEYYEASYVEHPVCPIPKDKRIGLKEN